MRDFSDFIERAIVGRTTIAGIDDAAVRAVVKATVEAIDQAVGADTTVEQLSDGAECANCGIWFAMSALQAVGGGGDRRDDAPDDDEDDEAPVSAEDFCGDYLCGDCHG